MLSLTVIVKIMWEVILIDWYAVSEICCYSDVLTTAGKCQERHWTEYVVTYCSLTVWSLSHTVYLTHSLSLYLSLYIFLSLPHWIPLSLSNPLSVFHPECRALMAHIQLVWSVLKAQHQHRPSLQTRCFGCCSSVYFVCLFTFGSQQKYGFIFPRMN